MLCPLFCTLPQVIVQYILDKYEGVGPSLRAATPELRAIAALATRIHDQYITPIQVGEQPRRASAAPAAAHSR